MITEQQFERFIPFAKVDVERREVWGIVTEEKPDKEKEVCDYAKTKPYYEAWSAEFAKATDGKSYGNLRYMHQLDAIGKAVAPPDFRDAQKQIAMGFKVTDDKRWSDVLEGVLTGFSHGGSVVGDMEPDPVYKGCMRYVAKPAEVSLVDNPCLSTARFDMVRADGVIEKVTPAGLRKQKEQQMKTKLELGPAAFAFVGNSEDPATWLYQVDGFENEAQARGELTRSFLAFRRAAPQEAKATVEARLKAAAKQHNVNLKSLAQLEGVVAKELESQLAKGMYCISNFAYQIEELGYLLSSLVCEREREDDDSTIPDDLRDVILRLGDLLVAYTTEQISELREELTEDETASLAEFEVGGMYMSEKNTDLAKSAKFHKAAHEFHTKKAEAHVEMHKLHKARAAAIGKTTASDVKDRQDFHEKKAAHHDEMSKLHKAHAEVHKEAAEAAGKLEDQHNADQGQKTAAQKAADEAKAAADKAAAAKSAGAAPNLQSLISGSISETMADAVKEVVKSPEFKASLQEMVLNETRNMLQPTTVKVAGLDTVNNQPIARPGETIESQAAELDPEVQHLVQ